LSDTVETFGGQDYDTKWKEGTYLFKTVGGSSISLDHIVFGEVNEQIFLPPGGLFFGLVKYTSSEIRPTFLSQTRFQSFVFDPLRSILTLSLDPLINKSRRKMRKMNNNIKGSSPPSSAVFKMVDLRPYGCPVFNYAVRVTSLVINQNGYNLCKKFPTIFAIFDTGTSGSSLSEDLKNDEDTPPNPYAIDVTMEDETGQPLTLSAKRSKEGFFVINGTPIPWFKLGSAKLLRTKRPPSESSGLSRFLNDVDDALQQGTSTLRPQIVVLGLAVIKQNVLTIDIDEGRLMISPPSPSPPPPPPPSTPSPTSLASSGKKT